jgi:opacity protein-like surface antigen
MRIAGHLIAAALLGGITSPAMAADPYYPPEEVVPVVSYGGWYLRGHIGMSNQDLKRLDSDLFQDPFITDYGWHDEGGFGSAPIFGGGIGYRLNDYLRGDLTAEYRGKSDFNALDWVELSDGRAFTNDYRAKKSEWLFMANAYADLGTFSGITPYVGAGLGASYNTISHFRDINIINGGGAYADKDSQWNLAWALHAGLGIQATERVTVDFGYSFVSLGDARTKQLMNDDPDYTLANDGFRFKDLTSHDLKVGLRYALN